MPRRRRVIVDESEIVNDWPEKPVRGVGRRGVRVSRERTQPAPQEAPARPWVKPEGHTPAPLVSTYQGLEIHWAKPVENRGDTPWPKDWPPYALDGPPSQRSR